MGYRSEVALVIEFKTKEQADNYLATALKKFSPDSEDNYYIQQVESKVAYLFFTSAWVKWYDDYEDVMEMTKFYQNSVDADGFVGYAFARVGEEDQDIETEYEGEHAYEYINVVRKLEVCV